MINKLHYENDNKHVFVNLSHLVLNRIIRQLNNNLDIICFSLVCRKWFQEREKYMEFTITSDKFTDRNFFLKDYQDLLLNQCSEYQRILYIGEFEPKGYCNAFLNYNDIDFENYIIPKSINKIVLSKNFNIDLKHFHKLLSESNVETIVMEADCKYNHPIDRDTFPSNIKNIKLGTHWDQPLSSPGCFVNGLQHLYLGFKFDGPLGKDCFPSTLQSLQLSNSFRKPLQPGSLPEGLVSLRLGQYSTSIQKNAIPSSLERLELGGLSQSIESGVLLPAAANLRYIKAGVRFGIDDIGCLYNLEHLDLSNTRENRFFMKDLPSNLKTIIFGLDQFRLTGNFPTKLEKLVFKSNSDIILDTGTTLPNSLKSIDGMPISWFEFIRESTSLEYVTCQSSKSQYIIQPGDIPTSLTYLDFNNNPTTLKPNIIPSTIKHLFLRKCIYDLEAPGMLPMDAQFETLYLANYGNKPIKPGVLPPCIKNLTIELQNSIDLQPGSIPFGVQSLEINFLVLLDYPSFLPESVTELTLICPPFGSNRNNNQNIDYNFWQDKTDIFPTSITTLNLRTPTTHLPLLSNSLDNITMLTLGSDSMFKRIDEKYFVIFNQNNSFKCFVQQSQLSRIFHYAKQQFLTLSPVIQ